MSEKHTFTPGPWHRIPESPRRGTEFSVYAEEFLIAETISEANARLIACAPEMARMVEQFAHSACVIHGPTLGCEPDPKDGWMCPPCQARALLARIRGEQT